jgi:hypothetical protein
MREEQKFFGKTYEELFEKSFKSLCRGREDHEFRHFNNSLNMMIYSKEHYISEMRKRRMLPIDTCEELAEKWESRNEKNYKPYENLSAKPSAIIKSLKLSADRNGNIRLGDRAINALKEIGAITGRVEDFGINGGFS